MLTFLVNINTFAYQCQVKSASLKCFQRLTIFSLNFEILRGTIKLGNFIDFSASAFNFASRHFSLRWSDNYNLQKKTPTKRSKRLRELKNPFVTWNYSLRDIGRSFNNINQVSHAKTVNDYGSTKNIKVSSEMKVRNFHLKISGVKCFSCQKIRTYCKELQK